VREKINAKIDRWFTIIKAWQNLKGVMNKMKRYEEL
jgi:hypothetical protein